MSKIHTPAYMSPMLPLWLRRIFSSKSDKAPRRASNLYEIEFSEAYARTFSWGLRPPSIEPQPVRCASPDKVAAVRRQLLRAIGHLSEELIATQRFGITAAVRGPLESELRVPLTYTLGYVQQDGQRLCHTPLKELEGMLYACCVPATNVSLHPWLTLPGREIIDVCFWAGFYELSRADERKARCLFMHPDQMPGRTYHPQWVGEGFVRAISVLKEYEGW